jgi:hypothetical protein
MEGGDIGLGMGAPDGGAMEGGDIGLGMGAPDGGAMEGGDGGDDGLGSGAADVGGMAGGIGERPGGVWSAASTTTMSFWLAVQLAWLPLMKKKGPERSSGKTVLPPSNLVMYVVVLQALYAAWSTRRTESVSFGYTNTAEKTRMISHAMVNQPLLIRVWEGELTELVTDLEPHPPGPRVEWLGARGRHTPPFVVADSELRCARRRSHESEAEEPC